jgi:hypothetical protein
MGYRPTDKYIPDTRSNMVLVLSSGKLFYISKNTGMINIQAPNDEEILWFKCLNLDIILPVLSNYHLFIETNGCLYYTKVNNMHVLDYWTEIKLFNSPIKDIYHTGHGDFDFFLVYNSGYIDSQYGYKPNVIYHLINRELEHFIICSNVRGLIRFTKERLLIVDVEQKNIIFSDCIDVGDFPAPTSGYAEFLTSLHRGLISVKVEDKVTLGSIKFTSRHDRCYLTKLREYEQVVKYYHDDYSSITIILQEDGTLTFLHYSTDHKLTNEVKFNDVKDIVYYNGHLTYFINNMDQLRSVSRYDVVNPNFVTRWLQWYSTFQCYAPPNSTLSPMIKDKAILTKNARKVS